ncbi:hypothetical protein [Candidatus Rhodobacter oscarellae]|uniref:hypothetical protein n=1 Tax=Candidatus Rhodobacter oscarellae TaxID=1675527 RepID=UPI000671239A
MIVSLIIPAEDATEKFATFKIMPRYQNAHAYVNAGFSMKVTESRLKLIPLGTCFVYGGIAARTVRPKRS